MDTHCDVWDMNWCDPVANNGLGGYIRSNLNNDITICGVYKTMIENLFRSYYVQLVASFRQQCAQGKPIAWRKPDIKPISFPLKDQ